MHFVMVEHTVIIIIFFHTEEKTYVALCFLPYLLERSTKANPNPQSFLYQVQLLYKLYIVYNKLYINTVKRVMGYEKNGLSLVYAEKVSQTCFTYTSSSEMQVKLQIQQSQPWHHFSFSMDVLKSQESYLWLLKTE